MKDNFRMPTPQGYETFLAQPRPKKIGIWLKIKNKWIYKGEFNFSENTLKATAFSFASLFRHNIKNVKAKYIF